MSKEYLEALNYVWYNYYTEELSRNEVEEIEKNLNIVQDGLKRLEAIDNAKPSVVLKFIDDLLKRYENKTDYNIYITKDWLLEIKQSLQRLESIDNAKPSEALECLEKLKGMEISSMPFSDEYGTQEVDLNDIRKVGSQLNTDFREYTTTIKQALLKAQEQEFNNGGRLPNKEILSLKQCVEKCKDKPILYISETYGNKYIVSQKELDDLTKEKELSKGQMKYLTEVVSEFQKIVRIIKPSLRLVGNCLQAKAPFVDDYHPWVFIKEITDEEELKLLKEMLE